MSKMLLEIDGKQIGNGCYPYLMLEAGCNFEGDLDRAEEMLRHAAACGAPAIKFQTARPENVVTATAEKFWEIDGCPGSTQLEEFQQTHFLTVDEYRELQPIAREAGITLLTTPEDEELLRELDGLGMPAMKISSMNLTHYPLLEAAAGTGKPVILSTGMAEIAEISDALDCLRGHGAAQVALLHCITSYPTPNCDANLGMITGLRRAFPGIPIGYSDHTISDANRTTMIAALAMGACLLEKHYTFDKTRPGYDHEISFDYDDVQSFAESIEIYWQARGSAAKVAIAREKVVRDRARRSLTSAVAISQGTAVTREMLAVKRPGDGIPSREIERLVGSAAATDIPADTTLHWEMFEKRGAAGE